MRSRRGHDVWWRSVGWLRNLVPIVFASVALGCGGDDAADAAAPTDGPEALLVDIPWLEDGAPPIALTPCPEGWREVGDGSGVMTCDPYPEGGGLDCPDGEAHFPGEPGCAPIGSPCPSSGEFSEALPADAPRIVYVQPGATGDGSSSTTPLGSLTAFSIGSLPTGTVIALSRGAHVGPVRLTRGVALWGACAAETSLTAPDPAADEGVITFIGAGEVHDLTVRDSPRRGVRVALGAEGTLDGVAVVGTEGLGVSVNGALTARGVVVRGTRSRATDGGLGRGVDVEDRGTAELSRVLIEDNHDLGVYASNEGTTLTLTDAVVRRTRGRERDRSAGRGLGVQRGATAELSRVLFEDNRESCVFAYGAGTVLSLADAIVRRTQSQESDAIGGRGFTIQDGATVGLSRALVEDNQEFGLFAHGEGVAVTMTDAIVRRTLSQGSDGRFGRGVSVQLGVSAELSRVLVEDNHEVGVYAGAATLALTDAVVRRTGSQESDGNDGRAVGVEAGATAALSRVLFEHNRDIGLYASRDTMVTLTDGVVSDTMARACAATTCADAGAGHGLSSVDGASLSASRFILERSNLCGVFLARDGQVDLMDGEVRDSPIGACLQVDGYDTDRLTRRVRFIDNELNLQATSLPVPEPADTIPTP